MSAVRASRRLRRSFEGKRAAVYARISKDEEGRQVGVDRQIRLCRQLAGELGVEVVLVLTDNDKSAFSQKVRRPGFERLVEAMKDGEVDVVLAYHPDRIYRRNSLLESIINIVEATGCDIQTVRAGEIDLSTPSGRLSARSVGAAAQYESERTSERIRDQVAEAVDAGKAPGGEAPYGYGRTPDGNYVTNRAEAKVVKRMAGWIVEGASLLEVSRRLEAAGVPTRRGGKRWPVATIRSTVTRPAVAGLRVHKGEVAGPGQWPAILERAEWEQVRAVIQDPARKRTRPVRKHLLSGFVFDVQGVAMMGFTVGQPGERRRSVYRTHWQLPPPAGERVFTQIDGEALEEFVIGRILERSDATVLGPAPATPVVLDPVSAEVARLEAEEAELDALRSRKVISLETFTAASQSLAERLEAARAATCAPRRQSPKLERLLGKPGALRKAWPGMSFDDRREVIAAVVNRIVVLRAGGRSRWVPVRDRVDPRPFWRDQQPAARSARKVERKKR